MRSTSNSLNESSFKEEREIREEDEDEFSAEYLQQNQD